MYHFTISPVTHHVAISPYPTNTGYSALFLFSDSSHLNECEAVEGDPICTLTLPLRNAGLERRCDLPTVSQAACSRAALQAQGCLQLSGALNSPYPGKSLLSNWSVTALEPPTPSELRQEGGIDPQRDPSPAQSTRTTPALWISQTQATLKLAFQQRPYPARPAELWAWSPLRAGPPSQAARLERAVRSERKWGPELAPQPPDGPVAP